LAGHDLFWRCDLFGFLADHAERSHPDVVNPAHPALAEGREGQRAEEFIRWSQIDRPNAA
jgi:hypothetical protein